MAGPRKKSQTRTNEEIVARAEQAEEEIEKSAWGRRGLTLRQKKFVYHYLRDAAGNSSEAARLAGYTSTTARALRTNACRLLHKPNVQRALTRSVGRMFGGAKSIRLNIAAIANGNAIDALKIDESGVAMLNIQGMIDAGTVGLIQKIKCNDEGQVVGIELYSKLKALELAAKMAGILTEKHDITTGGDPITFTLKIGDAEPTQ